MLVFIGVINDKCCFLSAVPNPPLNVSLKILHLSGSDPHGVLLKASHNASFLRRTRDVPSTKEQEGADPDEVGVTQTPLNESVTDGDSSTTEPTHDNSTEPLWAEPMGSPAPTEEEEEEFVNAVLPEYEDSNEPGSAMDVNFDPRVRLDVTLDPRVRPNPLSVLLELRWSPPTTHTSFDGFNIYIYRDGENNLS